MVLPALVTSLLVALPPSPHVESQTAAAKAAQSRAATPSRSELIKASLPATVLIQGKTSDGAEKFGSGFIVDASGTIVTNLHVIRGLLQAEVRLENGDVYDRITIRAYDERKDLAVIQVPGFGLPALRMADSEVVQPGDAVLLIGSPLGLQGSVSTGIVSAVRPLDGYRVFQTDAAANPGNSGGPMLNDAGEVIGVLTFGARNGENLNFVVPVNYVRGLLMVNDALSLTELAKRLPREETTPRADPVPEVSAPKANRAEDSRASGTASLGPAASGAESTHALIYVFRDAAFFGRALEPRVTLDDVELVTMDNKRYFSVWVTPGQHWLNVGGGMTQSCEQPLNGNFEAGMVYFARVELYANSCFFLRAMNPDVASVHIKKLKPLNTSNVKHQAVRLQ